MDRVLVVDLDGTLIRSDMLFETFWSALGRDWRSPARAAGALVQGRSALKRVLAKAGPVDVGLLPYDEAVLEHIRAWRAAGGETALVTASDEVIAQQIADHLGLFDAVHGSNGETNLKGANKAAFLRSRFGRGGFDYMGDSASDIVVWEEAQRAITVNASARLRTAAEEAAEEAVHLGRTGRALTEYLSALRPHQWLKNILVFLPLLASHQFSGGTLLAAIGAFVAFCLMASSAYVLNDLLDLAADRAHPRKRERPFASGRVPIADGSVMAVGLFVSGALVALLVSSETALILLIYFALTLAYSLFLKRVIVLDICMLGLLYTIRILAGGVAAGIPISVWLLAFSMFFFLSLAAVKRQAELVDSAARGELSIGGRGYHPEDLPVVSMIAIGAGYVSVMVMALYVNSPVVVMLYAWPEALWGICGVLIYWITRIVLITHRGGMHDDPVVFAARDRVSQVSFVLILVIALAGSLG